MVEDANASGVGRVDMFEFFNAGDVELVGESAHALSAFMISPGLKHRVRADRHGARPCQG